MLSIQNLTFHFGSRTMYDEASLHIVPKQRIGIIGRNGAGKTTLLKLINGDLTPDGGSISKPNDCTIGFLNQDLLSYQSDESILNVAMMAFQEALDIQDQIDETLLAMEEAYSDELLHKLTRLQERFEQLDGYTIKAKTESILEGLGFSTEDLQKPLRHFSGGWRMRVMLAKLLLQRPSVLMLDEPTNHLDLPSIQWLEQYINNYEGVVIIVSHDREFLDRAINTTVEVTSGKIIAYAGNYSFYLEEKSLRNELQHNAFVNQQQKIKQAEQFIDRFRAKASKSRQVQSRVKMLDKLDTIDDVQHDNASINMRFTFQQQPGKIIAELDNITKYYGDHLILKDTNITLERGDKVAFIGANGKGKSTLLRLIDQREPVQAGEVVLGHNVITTFYAQHQLESLNVENDLITELKQAGSNRTEAELRNLLGCFLFQGDEVFKRIKVLSGGEKSRVALAKTLISEANFLMLDEPTNHLDIRSVNTLIQALQAYEGSYVVVSHDRHFISHIANKIWYIEDHVVKEYPGDYDEFCVWMAERKAEEDEQRKAQLQEQRQNAKTPVVKATRNVSEDKEAQKRITQLSKQIERLEAEIMSMEIEKEEIEEELGNPDLYGQANRLADVQSRYESLKKRLTQANEQWEQHCEERKRLS